MRIDLNGNPIVHPDGREEREAANEKRRIQQVEDLIAAGKITGNRLANWRKDHPEPKAEEGTKKGRSASGEKVV